MRFIELHYGNGESLYVNPQKVDVIADRTTKDGKKISCIYINGNDCPHMCIESAEEVVQMINRIGR